MAQRYSIFKSKNTVRVILLELPEHFHEIGYDRNGEVYTENSFDEYKISNDLQDEMRELALLEFESNLT